VFCRKYKREMEGLDFHHYCHAIVHWNLPSNPVDLEQREVDFRRQAAWGVESVQHQAASLSI